MNTFQKPQEHSRRTVKLTKEEWLKKNPFLTEEEAEELAKEPVTLPGSEDLRKLPDKDMMDP